MTSITKIIGEINVIKNPVKNGYISIKDLDILIENLGPLLDSAINAKNRMITTPHYGLDVIFPAINHLILFLDAEDLGSIALVSKTLHNLMVSNFTQLQTEIFILQHYVGNHAYNFNINIDFLVNDKKITIPLNIKMIKFKQIRKMVGYEKFQQLYGQNPHRFFRDDYISQMSKNNEISYYRTILCLFCEKPNLYYEDHKNCAANYNENSPIKYSNFDNIKIVRHYNLTINYLHPELEYLAIQILKQNMPDKMKKTCNGIFVDRGDEICQKCGIFKHIHDLYKKK